MTNIKIDTKSYDLRYKSISKLLLAYSIPSVISMLTVALYNIVDRIFIGHSLGAMAISGLAISLPIMSMITAFGTLVGIGATSRISIVMGRRDIGWAKNILCHFPIMTAVISSIFSILAFIFLDEILYLFGATETTLPYARSYLKIIIPTSIFSNLCFGFSHILRATGYPAKSMYAILIGVVLNIILDPIFLFGFKTGIEGVAVATAISMAVGTIYTLIHFCNKSNTIHFDWKGFKIRGYIIRNILSIGFSPFTMNLVASGIVMLVNIQLAKYGGDYAIGAFGIIYSYQLFLVLMIMGITNAMQPIIGYNYGAENYKRVKDTLFLAIRITTFCTIPFFIATQFFPDMLSRAFTTDAEMIRQASIGFKYAFRGSLFIGFGISISVFFLSISKAKESVFMSLSRQVVFLIPLIIILPMFFGINGIWYSMSISDFAAFLLSTWFLSSELKKIYIKSSNKNTSFLKIWKPVKQIKNSVSRDKSGGK